MTLTRAEVLFDEKQIARRVDELGREIGQSFAGSQPCVVGLIDKPGDRKIDVHPDWAAFTLPESLKDDRFIVGYGLDHAEGYRGLPYLGTIPRPAPPVEGRKITISGGGS